jgi:hypothetical protein
MNRESAKLILENRALIPVHVMDDIGFGTAFMKMGISPSNLESMDFESVSDLGHFSKKTLETIAHFRFKSGPLHSRGDVAIMKELITNCEARCQGAHALNWSKTLKVAQRDH